MRIFFFIFSYILLCNSLIQADTKLHDVDKIENYNSKTNQELPESNKPQPLSDGELLPVNNKNLAEELGADSLEETEGVKFNSDSRPLQVGDTITPEEMLEVSKRLLSQVGNPGQGKGIVSASRNEFELADKIFERYFMTLQRMVVIQDIDIDGLDALQALSLNGEVVDMLRSASDSYTEAPRDRYKGFQAAPSIALYGLDATDYPSKCHYKVLKKPTIAVASGTKRTQGKKHMLFDNIAVTNKDNISKGENDFVVRRFIIKAMKTEDANRTTKSSKHNIDNNLTLTTNRTPKKYDRTDSLNGNSTCRWRYNCTVAWSLQSCRLLADCSNQSNVETMFEADESLRRFRKMIGILKIDEEVEKIFEMHIMRMYPKKYGARDKNIDTLIKYFNDIIAADSGKGAQTTPMAKENTAHFLKSRHRKTYNSKLDNEEAKMNVAMINK